MYVCMYIDMYVAIVVFLYFNSNVCNRHSTQYITDNYNVDSKSTTTDYYSTYLYTCRNSYNYNDVTKLHITVN